MTIQEFLNVMNSGEEMEGALLHILLCMNYRRKH